jgi:hypothetical protein
MVTTIYKYKKLLLGIIFSYNLLHGSNLSAQTTFHLAGSYISCENSVKDSTLFIQKIKITNPPAKNSSAIPVKLKCNKSESKNQIKIIFGNTGKEEKIFASYKDNR